MIVNSYVDRDELRSTFEEKVRQLTNASEIRQIRSCCSSGHDDTVVLFNNTTIGIIIIILSIILVLLLLGCIKGLCGLYCWPPVGMCGLGALIDLPRPLDEYQEDELREFPVQYDMIGWPVHPQTNRRTVRALSLRSEFCLNVIFFLTYPLIMLITLLTTCCFAHVYDNEDTTDTIYKKDHTIMLTECPSIMCPSNTNKIDSKCITLGGNVSERIYNDESGAEESDTRYVFDQMRKSQETLRYS